MKPPHFIKNTVKKEFITTIKYNTNEINFKRLTYFFIAMILIEPFIIIFFDIRGLISGSYPSIYYFSYLGLHLFLWLLAIIWLLFKRKILLASHRYSLLLPGITCLILAILSLINGLDQIQNAPNNVFIANLLMFCAALLFAFPVNLLVLLPSYLLFTAGLFVFQTNPVSRLNNLVNGSIFFLAVVVISTYIYRYYFENSLQTLELKAANNKLNYLSNHDRLTDLLNRDAFENQLLKMDPNQTIILILLDIDHFKKINDTFGHLMGDQVLIQLAQTLKNSIPDTFIVSRWGGEEFQIAGPVATLEEGTSIAEKIRRQVELNSIISEKGHIHYTASFGVTQLCCNFENNLDNCFKEADTALYKAKENGRNRVEFGLPG